MGQGTCSLFISLMRFIIVPLPMAFLLSKIAQAQIYVWLSIPAGEALGALLALFLTLSLVRKRTA